MATIKPGTRRQVIPILLSLSPHNAELSTALMSI
jgi:hypothetical protein